MLFLPTLLCTLAVLAQPHPSGTATEFSVPSNVSVQSVGGSTMHVTKGARPLFDRVGLERLEKRKSETRTIRTGTPPQLTGVTLRSLLEAVGATGHCIDAPAKAPVIAHHDRRAAVSVRDKGTLGLMYPHDADPAVRPCHIHARSIWQFDRIDVLD